MDRLQFLIDPAPDAVQTASDLILMLMTTQSIIPTGVHVHTRQNTGQIEIIAEYNQNKPSAPLLHPLKTVKKSNTSKFTSYRRHRSCTASARPARMN